MRKVLQSPMITATLLLAVLSQFVRSAGGVYLSSELFESQVTLDYAAVHLWWLADRGLSQARDGSASSSVRQESCFQIGGILQCGGTHSKSVQTQGSDCSDDQQSGLRSSPSGKHGQTDQQQSSACEADHQAEEPDCDVSAATSPYCVVAVDQVRYHVDRSQVLSHLHSNVSDVDIDLECQSPGCQKRIVSPEKLLQHTAIHHRRRTALDPASQPIALLRRGQVQNRSLSSTVEEPEPPPLVDGSLSVLCFMIRYGTRETLLDLMLQFDSVSAATYLQQPDQCVLALLHELSRSASGYVIWMFIHRFGELIKPELLSVLGCQSRPAQQPLFQKSVFPVVVTDLIFRQLDLDDQIALSQTCRRLNGHFRGGLSRLVFQPLVQRYFSVWTRQYTDESTCFWQQRLSVLCRKLRTAGVPDYFIDESRRHPLYPLALLRFLSSRKKTGLFLQVSLVRGGGITYPQMASRSVLGDELRFVGKTQASVHPSMAVLPNRNWLAVSFSDGWIDFWRVEPEGITFIRSMLRAPEQSAPKGIKVVAALTDYSLAAVNWDTVEIWDVDRNCRIRSLRGHRSFVFSLAVLPSGLLASGSADNTVKIWDTGTGRCASTLNGHSDVVAALAVLPDCRLASGSWDHNIKIWDTRTWKCILTLRQHSSRITSLIVLSNGLLASSDWFGKLVISDIESKTCTACTGVKGLVIKLALRPDGLLLSLSDRAIQIWDTGSGVALATRKIGPDNLALVVLSDGGVAVSKRTGIIEIWDMYHPTRDSDYKRQVDRLQSR